MEDGGPRLECRQWRLQKDIVIVFDKVSGIIMEIKVDWFEVL